MAWVRIDDQFSDHPKIVKAGPIALVLQVRAFCYAARHLTDGYIPAELVPIFLAGLEKLGADPSADWGRFMVEARLWDPTEGGYLVHDYLDYNPSREEVLADQRRTSNRGVAGGRARVSLARRERGKFAPMLPFTSEPASEPASGEPATTIPPSPSPPLPGPLPGPQQDPPVPVVVGRGGSPEGGSAPTGNGLPDWFRDTLRRSEYFRGLAAGHETFWRTMSTRFDPYDWLAWDEEIQKADTWCAANPAKAPTPRGTPAFLRNWFERAVKDGRTRPHAPPKD